MSGSSASRIQESALLDLHLRVFERLFAIDGQRRFVLLETLRDAAIADRNVGAVLLQIGLALVGDIFDGAGHSLQLNRSVVERVGAASGNLVLMRRKTLQNAAFPFGDVLAIGIDVLLTTDTRALDDIFG